jgi:hypothetical protein
MAKIINCNGIIDEFSDLTEINAAKLLWGRYETEKNPVIAKMYYEMHNLVCAVLHGGKVIETQPSTDKCKAAYAEYNSEKTGVN